MITFASLSDLDVIAQQALRRSFVFERLPDHTEIDAERHEVLFIDIRPFLNEATHVAAGPLASDLPEPVAVTPCKVLTRLGDTMIPAHTGVPLVVLVDDEHVPELIRSQWPFDELVTPAELGTCSFAGRMQRLVQRYRCSISLSALQQPEFLVLQQIVNHTADWVIVKDLEHRFLMVSDKFVEIIGLPRKLIIGRNDLQIGNSEMAVFGNPDAGWPGFWPQDDAVIATGEASFEVSENWRTFEFERYCGRTEKMPLKNAGTERVPLKNASGEVYALLIRITDKTNMVNAERSLHARNKLLRRVREEMCKVQEHRRVAEQTIAEKNMFMAAASHDLRQPLHALGLFLDVLDRRLTATNDREVLAKIRHSTDDLNALFNSLLDISRLDAGLVEVNRQDVEVSRLFYNLREEFSAQGAHKLLHVTVTSCHATVHTDPILLGRILRNLLQNAVTHTNVGRITVKSNISHGRLRISISDTGPGIPLDEQDAIFSEFYQLNSSQDCSTCGLGLGLAIVRRLANLLDIRVTLASEVGKGTTFSVAVPLGTQRHNSSRTADTLVADLAGFRVLVIDDDPSIRDALGRMLSDYGCETLSASSATEAITLFEQNAEKPDVIVMDYTVRDDVSGNAAINALRTHLGIDVPVIIVTGDTSATRLRDARETGCSLLHKPVKPKELVGTIAELLDA